MIIIKEDGVMGRVPHGYLANKFCKIKLQLSILQSNKGFYLGTSNDSGPVSRESLEYWHTRKGAENALDNKDWTQRETP